MDHDITLAFLIVVMVVFLLMVQTCTNLAKKYPLNELQPQIQEPWSCEQMMGRYGWNPQNNKMLISVGKDYYDPMFQGLGYSYGRQFVNQDYGDIVMPNPDLYPRRQVYNLMEKASGPKVQTARPNHSLTNSGPSKESMTGGGREWEHGVLGGGPDDAYMVAKFHHFPGGDKATWM